MLEESVSMDKKNLVGRSTPGSSKSNVSDAKNKQDGSQITRFPRNSKRREPSVTYYRSENSKKPNPQKTKALDKRPRVRGYYNERSRNEVAEEYLRAEYGSALMQGSKKINLNHLLNFTYTPRVSGGNSVSRGWSSSSWKTRNNWVHHKNPFNKEQFLQANCQFVVRDSGDYAVHAVDPDMLVDWELIEQVRIFSHEIPSCPICLYPPTAAKITRCGHIFCWTCILHYLALTDKTWRKCPICYEAIHKNDLKSVMALTTPQYTVGDKITMQLMKKERGTVFAIPKNQWTERNGKIYRVDETVNTSFMKLLLASSHHSQQIIDVERKALEEQLKEEFNQPEICFTETALEELKEREKHLQESHNIVDKLHSCLDALLIKDEPLQDFSQTTETTTKHTNTKMVVYSCAFSDEEETETCAAEAYQEDCQFEDTESILCHDLSQNISVSSVLDDEYLVMPEVSIDATSGSKNAAKNAHYFYQASDGQHIYLHVLNVRCLLKEFGEWENCPDTITATIVELENVSITQDLRRRLRYLAHLPLTCEVEFAELRLEPPLISKSNLKFFYDDIQKRKQARNKRNRDERRWEKRAAVESKRKTCHYTEENFGSSSQQYPEDFQNLDNCPPLLKSSEDIPVFGSPSSTSVNLCDSPSHCEDVQFPSFAQMLRQGKAKPENWPKVPSKEPEDTQIIDADTSEPEDYVPVPTYQHSFGDAIQAALASITHSSQEEDKLQPGQKKKKNKKKLLFSTTMARSK